MWDLARDEDEVGRHHCLGLVGVSVVCVYWGWLFGEDRYVRRGRRLDISSSPSPGGEGFVC